MEIYHPEEKEILREMKRVRRVAREKRLGWGLLISAVLAALIGFLVFNRFYMLTTVHGPGMENTIQGGSLVVCRRTYGARPERGDMILYNRDGDYQIKRAIAAGGDSVVVSATGEIRVNGTLLREDYTTGNAMDTGILARRAEVDQNQVFVVGDNRSLSVDSRSTDYGLIEQEDVLGKAVAVIWPLYRFEILQPAATQAAETAEPEDGNPEELPAEETTEEAPAETGPAETEEPASGGNNGEEMAEDS